MADGINLTVDPVGKSFTSNVLGNFVNYIICIVVYFFSVLFVNPYTMKWRLENQICEESVTMATSLGAISSATHIINTEIAALQKSKHRLKDDMTANNLKLLQDTASALMFLKTSYRSCGQMDQLGDAVETVSNKIIQNFKTVANVCNLSKSIMVSQILQTRGVPATMHTVADTLTGMRTNNDDVEM